MRIVLGGDVMLGRQIDRHFLAHDRSPFALIADRLLEADLACVNLECAITARVTWYQGPPKAFYFKARPKAARVLAEANVQLVSLANNHALDAGKDGLRDTLTLLDAQGIGHSGAGLDLAEASRPAVVEVGPKRVALLAYCNHQADFAATPEQAGIRYLGLEDLGAAIAVLEADIGRIRNQSDVLIVALHWQPNWAPVVQDNYRRIAHACLCAGALVVWGHSPHHFQGIEFSRGGAILYSTGDFIDDYAVDPVFRNDRQLLFALEVGASGIERIEAFPLEIADGYALPAREEAAHWIEGTFRHACEPFGTLLESRGDRLILEPVRPAERVSIAEEGEAEMRDNPQLVDESIQHDVLEELQFDPEVPAADIGVRVNDGVVTLLGTVASFALRHAAEEATKRVGGVRGIVDALEVLMPGPVHRTDEDIARDALTAFDLNDRVPTSALRVLVDRGRVVLEGEVEWGYQRQAAEEVVRTIPGVREVSNQIKILARPLPAAIRRRIRHAFVRHAKLDAKDIDVEFQDHKIILKGQVRSLAERSEAERIAWSVSGVTEVADELVVRP